MEGYLEKLGTSRQERSGIIHVFEDLHGAHHIITLL